eukprot:TRINITY_DN38503_c0_g1_i1.p1 TRINITY_DN38503_c0_g1~~TRINITY_DN38503_c0_g1_i1.p1  ORF type:complete len:253 (-),score=53.74 TRINITY_DN38503_c0_g1_i1:355-1113(-)
MATDSMGLEIPEALTGFLLKESPNVLNSCFCRYQRRFVALQAGRTFYAADAGAVDPESGPPGCKGCIDFKLNHCEVCTEEDGIFIIRPAQGVWQHATFTGHDQGREFRFDASGSDVSLDRWMRAFKAHIRYAEDHKSARAAAARRPSFLGLQSSRPAPPPPKVRGADEPKPESPRREAPQPRAKRASMLASSIRQEAIRRASISAAAPSPAEEQASAADAKAAAAPPSAPAAAAAAAGGKPDEASAASPDKA